MGSGAEQRRQRRQQRRQQRLAKAMARPLPWILQGERRRAFLAAVSLTVVFMLVVIAVSACMVTIPSEAHPERGLYSFRLFTVFSNSVSAVACLLSLPFAIEGIRKDRYDIPEWCLTVHFAGATSVTVTMLFTFFFMLPVKGPAFAFGGANLYMHVICPILCICTFLFLESDHTMTLKNRLLSLVPFVVYAVVYFVNVVVRGEANGGWRDIYLLNTMVPIWVSLPLMVLLAYGVSCVLGALHNRISAKQAAFDERVAIAFTPVADEDTLDGQIALLAGRRVAKQTPGGPIVIPRRALELVGAKFGNEHTMENMCRLYLDCFMDAEKRK